MCDYLPMMVLLGAVNHLWYYAPLIVVVSLVYGATRHELMTPIVIHAVRCAVWITGFMAAILVFLWLISKSL